MCTHWIVIDCKLLPRRLVACLCSQFSTFQNLINFVISRVNSFMTHLFFFFWGKHSKHFTTCLKQRQFDRLSRASSVWRDEVIKIFIKHHFWCSVSKCAFYDKYCCLAVCIHPSFTPKYQISRWFHELWCELWRAGKRFTILLTLYISLLLTRVSYDTSSCERALNDGNVWSTWKTREEQQHRCSCWWWWCERALFFHPILTRN